MNMLGNGLIFYADDATFRKAVLGCEVPVLVDFWAPRCGPCNMLAPTFEELATEYKDRVRFIKVNVDESRQIALSLGVMGIPTVTLFRDGTPVEQKVGVQPKAVLTDMLERALLAARESSHRSEQAK